MQVTVQDNNVDKALQKLKRGLQLEGLLRVLKSKRYFEKKSEKRKRKKAEGVRRRRKSDRKRKEKLGF